MPADWKIVCEPEGRNPGKPDKPAPDLKTMSRRELVSYIEDEDINVEVKQSMTADDLRSAIVTAGKSGKNLGGMVVYLQMGGTHSRQEVARVAFEREYAKHPDKSFPEQLDTVMTTARAALGYLNETLNGEGELL